MNEPIEGALYRVPGGDLYRVLFVGDLHGHPGFITKRDELYLTGWKISDWQSQFFQPATLVAKMLPKSSDYPYGKHSYFRFWGKAVKCAVCGEIKIISVAEFNDEEITQLCQDFLEKQSKTKQ